MARPVRDEQQVPDAQRVPLALDLDDGLALEQQVEQQDAGQGGHGDSPGRREPAGRVEDTGHLEVAEDTLAAAPPAGPGTVRPLDGDALDPDDVAKAVVGQDAVVVTLGISDNPLAVHWLRRAGTALDVRSRGTRVVARAMADQGVRRLVVQTTYGLGDSWQLLDLRWKLTFRLVIGRQLTDSARQEDVVRASGLDWTLVRPVSLTDDDVAAPAHVTTDDSTVGMAVARSQVARAVADAVETPATVGATLSVSSA
ncbi:putative NAD(P)-binding protein [Isoptericola variabilis J7]|nr:NAD(P)-binding oxidoreductase [Isoptericola variabilis]TWH28523.1 putative NAD(P)-binding protein [Isoptericola variabilis J7]